MAPDPARPARRVTYLLMGLAYLACEVAAHLDGHLRPFGVAFGIALFVLAAVGSYFVPVPAPGQTAPPRKVTLLLAGVLVLPTLVEPLLREWADSGLPLELQLVNGMRNLGLALAAVSVWPTARRLAGVVALFLALFASAMGDQPQIPYVLVPLAVVGGVWLVLNHRAGLAGPAVSGAADATVERVSLRFPARELIVFGVLAAVAVGVVVTGPKRVMLTLGELVPTSGGTGSTDPFARHGVGDGPEETAGANAKAAGMVETDQMIEDTKDALIDAVNDMYGQPHKPAKNRDKMVAAGVMNVIQNHGKLPDNRRPSRDFDTARKGPKATRTPDSQAARGLFEVEGRTPLHVRLVAYDRYEADDPPAAALAVAGGAAAGGRFTGWRWRAAGQPVNRGIEADAAAGRDWMARSNLGRGEWYAADDGHRLKAADLRSNLVPTPAMLTRFRVNRVDRTDYYEWDYDGVLVLAGRRKTPPGVVVQTECRTLDPARLPGAAFAGVATGAPPPFTDVPAELQPEIGRLAREWAGDAARGWPQIDAVLRRLRDGYTLDKEAAAPPDHPAPVLWFLSESRRGPDYLFASATALLLRSLGYPTRVCLGYYAAPDAYDPDTQHTPVRKTNLHLWPEVLLRDNQWLVVEPTPGYATLPPLRSWQQRATELAAAVLGWADRNAVGLAVGFAAAGLLAWRRKRAWDAVYTAAWRLAPGRTWRDAAWRAVRLLERRTRLAGHPRPPTQTLSGWAAGLGAGRPEAAGLAELVRLSEWASYAPALAPPVPEADVRAVCRRAVGEWTYRRMRQARPVATSGGAA